MRKCLLSCVAIAMFFGFVAAVKAETVNLKWVNSGLSGGYYMWDNMNAPYGYWDSTVLFNYPIGEEGSPSGYTNRTIPLLPKVVASSDPNVKLPSEVFSLEMQPWEGNSHNPAFYTTGVDFKVTSLKDAVWTRATDQSKATTGDGTATNSMTETKRNALDQLFGHVYGSILDDDGNYIPLVAQALQLAIHEIMEETTGVWDVYRGPVNNNPDKGTAYAGDYVYVHYDERNVKDAVDIFLANEFLAALQSNDWSGLSGYEDYTEYNLVVYSSEVWGLNQYNVNVKYYQNMIGVLPSADGSNNPDTTPEPATMLIFGLAGLAGLPAARRFRKK